MVSLSPKKCDEFHILTLRLYSANFSKNISPPDSIEAKGEELTLYG
jgi:hypothetical protein